MPDPLHAQTMSPRACVQAIFSQIGAVAKFVVVGAIAYEMQLQILNRPCTCRSCPCFGLGGNEETELTADAKV